jgi:hypothetical protein
LTIEHYVGNNVCKKSIVTFSIKSEKLEKEIADRLKCRESDARFTKNQLTSSYLIGRGP